MQNKNVKLLHFGNERTENGGVYYLILLRFFPLRKKIYVFNNVFNNNNMKHFFV